MKTKEKNKDKKKKTRIKKLLKGIRESTKRSEKWNKEEERKRLKLLTPAQRKKERELEKKFRAAEKRRIKKGIEFENNLTDKQHRLREDILSWYRDVSVLNATLGHPFLWSKRVLRETAKKRERVAQKLPKILKKHNATIKDVEKVFLKEERGYIMLNVSSDMSSHHYKERKRKLKR